VYNLVSRDMQCSRRRLVVVKVQGSWPPKEFSITSSPPLVFNSSKPMPSITLGRKRPSEAIILDGARQNKKVKFTEDGEAVVVKSTPVSASPAAHSSKVKPDYSKVTKRGDKKASQSRGDTKESNTGSSILNAEDIDFPRGGGSALTPLEHKEMRAEGVKEAEMEIFKVRMDTSLVLTLPEFFRRRKTKLLLLSPLESA
jgi:hypothetical protein